MTTTPTWFSRPDARQWRTPAPGTAAAPAFHAELPGYHPTELTELPGLAAELGVGRVFVKDESTRMGLGAFKVLGASWAVARLLTQKQDGRVTLDELRQAAVAHPVELVTATDGNHGRAVAWIARLLGLDARVFVPHVVPERARAAIAAEGATVTVAGGSYDEAVQQAAAYAGEGRPARRGPAGRRRGAAGRPRRAAAAGAGHRVGGIRERARVDRGGVRDPAG